MIGLIFVLHGWSKFEGGISGTVGFFESIGIPGFLASVVAIIELVGGAAMILGWEHVCLLPCLSSLWLACCLQPKWVSRS